MKKIVLATAAAAALVTLSAIGAARAAPVYMETGDKTFGTIDLSTGAYTNIGSSSYLGTPIQLSGLGASGGDIYGGAYLGTALYEVDTATGALSLIGNSTENYELTGSTATGLYEFGADGNLYSINPANGDATLVGATGITLGTWDGMSSGGSQLYVSSGANLYLINTSTGAGTFIGSISPAEFGAMVNVGGTWWGGNDLGPAQLYTFDPSTAAVSAGSALTGTTSNFWGLAVASTVPEPSTWAMMLVGFSALGFAAYCRSRSLASAEISGGAAKAL